MSGSARGRAGYPLALGASAILVLLVAVGGWGVGTTLAGAVVAPGHLEAEGERQAIEHAEGGVLAEILARDGDRVAAGAVLLRLDGTFLRSELAIVEGQLAEIHVRSARLRAERDGADLPAFDDAPSLDTVDAAALSALAEGERALFLARRDAQARALRQIGTQRVQVGRRIEGLGAQSAALARERALLGEQIADLAALVDRGLAEAGRLSVLRREAARLEGAGANLAAEVAAAETEIAALDLEALRLADLRREEAIARLRDLGAMRFELVQRQLALRERIARLEVRAPVAGTVFGSRIAAEGSVVRPGAATRGALSEIWPQFLQRLVDHQDGQAGLGLQPGDGRPDLLPDRPGPAPRSPRRGSAGAGWSSAPARSPASAARRPRASRRAGPFARPAAEKARHARHVPGPGRAAAIRFSATVRSRKAAPPFGHQPDAQPRRAMAAGRRSCPSKVRVPAAEHPADRLDRGGLAHAVAAHQRQHLALGPRSGRRRTAPGSGHSGLRPRDGQKLMPPPPDRLRAPPGRRGSRRAVPVAMTRP
jgi:HlyD family type I secretion membrane fusion protein